MLQSSLEPTIRLCISSVFYTEYAWAPVLVLYFLLVLTVSASIPGYFLPGTMAYSTIRHATIAPRSLFLYINLFKADALVQLTLYLIFGCKILLSWRFLSGYILGIK